MNKIFVVFFISLVFVALWAAIFRSVGVKNIKVNFTPSPSPILHPTPVTYPKSYISPSPSPTAKPLTFKEMNGKYGPCVYLPTVMYHHIQNADVAKAGGFSGLNVTITSFVTHLHYLKDKGYTTVTPNEIINFFDNGAAPPTKSVMLTFDDGYDDFYVNAFPLLRELGLKAVMFLPTGLVNNPKYLTWDQVTEMANSGVVYFANHTWSHKAVSSDPATVEREISLADSQLKDRGLNASRVFAYPYGNPSDYGIADLQKLSYTLAFTTWPGSTLCKGQRMTLPRVRVGNASLSAYGF